MPPITFFLFVGGMFLLGLADFTIKEAAGKITPALGALIYGLVTILPLSIWTLWSRGQQPLMVTREGVLWSVGTGLCFGIFTGLMFLLFSQGVNLSIGAPVIRMGALVFAASLGIIIFREGINWQYVIGFALAAVGIFLVATR